VAGHGVSDRIGCDIQFAPVQDQDFDFIATWSAGELRNFCPIQLKEIVPPHLNKLTTVQTVVDGLARYSDSTDVTVAVKLNQPGRFEPEKLKIPDNLRIGGLWIFGALSTDQSEFGLWGDFLNRIDPPFGTRFSYPSPVL
jgi:hypothetical protein